MYMVDDKGIASCIDIETGDSLWMERIGGRGGFGASPILIGDKLLIISLGGEATVLNAAALHGRASGHTMSMRPRLLGLCAAALRA